MTDETKVSFELSLVSGFVDTAGFIALFNLFTAHVTGNLVLAGAAFFAAGEHGSLAAKLLMLPIFIISVGCTNYVIKYNKATMQSLILMEALFIACFAVVGGWLLNSPNTPSGRTIFITSSFAVIGMAIQNTYMRKVLNSYTPNTMMTGNFTQFSIELFNLVEYNLAGRRTMNAGQIKGTLISFKKVVVVLSGFLILKPVKSRT